MSAHALTQNAYGDATRATGTPRSVEYQVFSQVTGRLNRARSEGRPFAELATALHDNLRLWTVIAADVASPGNALPAETRARLVHLAQFVRLHSQKVLREEADPGILIEINTAIMRGLRGELPPQES